MKGVYHAADGKDYPAKTIGAVDADLIDLEIELPAGHVDKPEGGTIMVHVPSSTFTPDA